MTAGNQPAEIDAAARIRASAGDPTSKVPGVTSVVTAGIPGSNTADFASAQARRDASKPDVTPGTSSAARGGPPAPSSGHLLEVLRDASGVTVATRRVCAWCGGEIPPRARRDALCCSVRCRQARHRFTRAVGRAEGIAAGHALHLAYADPPYPGNSRRFYRDHPDYAGEVDHAALIRQLQLYDGWALSTSAAALQSVLASCPPGVRVAAWHRGERPTRSAGPLNAWEPVIFFGGRPDTSGTTSRRVDSLVLHNNPRLTDPNRVIGAKPAAFARWVFELLGAHAGDTLWDVFPGSGGIGRAWATYTGAVAAAPDDASCSPAVATRRAGLGRSGDPSCGSPRRLTDASAPAGCSAS